MFHLILDKNGQSMINKPFPCERLKRSICLVCFGEYMC